MFILPEKMAPPRRTQTFNDSFEDAVRKREEDERWIQHIIKALSGNLRE
ncbi:hypothetical protein AB4Z51_42645 [Bradyrhizobium sp. 2TAF36]